MNALQAVNELLESLGAPLEILEGFVSSIAVTIPWAALVTDHCTLEVTGLQITCRPKYRTGEYLYTDVCGSVVWLNLQYVLCEHVLKWRIVILSLLSLSVP